jgi:heat-inducible transcriptional repressor
MELTDRQRMILGLVIREYIQNAAPVSSKVLVEKYPLGIGPATARNELAALEDSGYLTHPHTSAGRMPTEKGYRYFVEYLMQQGELPLEERLTIRHQFHQVNAEMDQMMRLSASVLARQTHTTALVTPPRASQSRYKHLELISLRDAVALLILVLQGGMVRQQVLTLDAPLAQESLTSIAGKLNHLYAGATSEQMRPDLTAADPMEAQVAGIVRDLLVQEDRQASQEIYRDGLGYMLDSPEFRQIHSLRQVVDLLERGTFFDEMLSEVMDRGGVQVIIGGEGRWEELSDCSVVVARYGGDSPISGALGVVGPTRMPYAHAISVVSYVSELMGDLIYDWYGY